MKWNFLVVIFFSILLLFSGPTAKAYTLSKGVEEGDIVDIEYQLDVEDEMIDQGRANFEISTEQLIYGFYLGVLGMGVSQEKSIVIPPEQGYTNPDHELYGKILYFTVYIFGIVVNIRDTISVNNNSSTVITSNSNVASEISQSDELTDISDLIESESVELSYNLFFGVFSILFIGFSRRRIS